MYTGKIKWLDSYSVYGSVYPIGWILSTCLDLHLKLHFYIQVWSGWAFSHLATGQALYLLLLSATVMAFSHGFGGFCLIPSLLVLFDHFTMSNSFVYYMVASMTFCDPWAPTLHTHPRTCSLIISMVFVIAMISLLILDIIVLSFMPLLNYI